VDARNADYANALNAAKFQVFDFVTEGETPAIMCAAALSTPFRN
jgi:hypothetical protein